MSDAKIRQAWDHTSYLVASLFEINRDPKRRRRPFKPHEFHPYHHKRRMHGPSLNDARTWDLLEHAFKVNGTKEAKQHAS